MSDSNLMPKTDYIMPLSAEEKAQLEQCETVITAGLKSFMDVAEALTVVKEKKLYREYRTWEEYCRSRWGMSASRSYQITSAMDTAKHIQTLTGVTMPNENVVREVRKHAVEDQPAIVAKAAVIAAAQNREMTQADIQAAATPPPPLNEDDQMRKRVLETRCAPIIKQMTDNVLTPAKAWDLWMTISKCQPVVRSDMLRLGLTSTPVILELNEWHKKGRDSYGEVVRSGHVQMADKSIPAVRATMTDLHDYSREKAEEYRRQAAALKDVEKGIEPVNLTLYTNDHQRNAEILSSMLGERQARKTAWAVMARTFSKRKVSRLATMAAMVAQ